MDLLHLAWDDAFLRYDFGPGHPMSPVRLALTRQLVDEFGLLSAPGVKVVDVEPIKDDVLLEVHSQEFVDAVKAASADLGSENRVRGLGSDDVPIFPGMHEVSSLIAAASRTVALDVWQGRAQHGVNFAGGMHHAMPEGASGFCVYNDAALAILAMLDAGATRVVYVDVDVHHGDGVEKVFWDDPRVMTISIHETGQVLFPGTGFAGEIGGARAEGDTVNLPLPPGSSDDDWLRAFHAVVPPLVRAFRPDVLVTQHGCDTHMLDPLAQMSLSLDCQCASYASLHDLAHEVCDGRWVALGGGGYEVVDVVPRAWTHLVAIAAHRPIEPATDIPQGWLDMVTQRLGRQAPRRMTDGAAPRGSVFAGDHNPERALDRVIMATRRAVFPLHGLDPWFD